MYDDENCKVLQIALKQSSHGLFAVIENEAEEQLKIAQNLQNYFTSQVVDIVDLSIKEKAEDFYNTLHIGNYINKNNDKSIFIICNLQEMFKSKDCVRFIQALNCVRDVLNQLNKKIVFCYSVEFNTLLHIHALDFYSFLSKVWFSHYDDNLEDAETKFKETMSKYGITKLTWY